LFRLGPEQVQGDREERRPGCLHLVIDSGACPAYHILYANSSDQIRVARGGSLSCGYCYTYGSGGSVWAGLAAVWAIVATESLLAIALVCVLMFFRDPSRATVQDDLMLVAPADGRIADIETVEESDFIGGRPCGLASS